MLLFGDYAKGQPNFAQRTTSLQCAASAPQLSFEELSSKTICMMQVAILYNTFHEKSCSSAQHFLWRRLQVYTGLSTILVSIL